jgi:hypothetical protein
MELLDYSFGTMTCTVLGEEHNIVLDQVALEGEYRMEESWRTDTEGQNGVYVSLQLSWRIATQNLSSGIKQYIWSGKEQIPELFGGIVLQTGVADKTTDRYELCDSLPYFPSVEDLSLYTANTRVCEQSIFYGFDPAYKDAVTITQIRIQKDSETTFAVVIIGTITDVKTRVDFQISLTRVPFSYVFTIHGYTDQYERVSRKERIADIMKCFAYHYDTKAFRTTILPAIPDREMVQVRFTLGDEVTM